MQRPANIFTFTSPTKFDIDGDVIMKTYKEISEKEKIQKEKEMFQAEAYIEYEQMQNEGREETVSESKKKEIPNGVDKKSFLEKKKQFHALVLEKISNEIRNLEISREMVEIKKALRDLEKN